MMRFSYVVLFVFIFEITALPAFAINTNLSLGTVTFTKPMTLNGAPFKTLDLDRTLLEQYKEKTADTRTLNEKKFEVKITYGKITKTLTSFGSMKDYVLGVDKGVSFINNIKDYKVSMNEAAKWTLLDEFLSSQINAYDYRLDMVANDLFEEYAELLQAENLEVQQMWLESAEQMVESAQQLYNEIFESSSQDAVGVGLLAALLACIFADAGATGCTFDKDCDGVPDTQDACPSNPNCSTMDDAEAKSKGDGIILPPWETEYFMNLGVTNTDFLSLIEIYNTYRTKMLINVMTMQTNLTQLFRGY